MYNSIHGPISPDIRKDEDVVHALLSVLRAEQSHGSNNDKQKWWLSFLNIVVNYWITSKKVRKNGNIIENRNIIP